jgi:hypothetical protein
LRLHAGSFSGGTELLIQFPFPFDGLRAAATGFRFRWGWQGIQEVSSEENFETAGIGILKRRDAEAQRFWIFEEGEV